MPTLAELFPDLGRRTLIMGVLNVTPDSFSDGGRFAALDAAVEHARHMFEAGADVIDIGGESTRPGAPSVSAEVEKGRVLPVIEALTKAGIGPLSIDTSKSRVATAAVEAGAVIVNDVSGGTFDAQMCAVVASCRASFVVMHTRARPETMQKGTWSYEGGVVRAVREALGAQVEAALAAGVAADAIAVDPGIGFGKTIEENMDLLAGVRDLRGLGYPVLVGTSRKSFVGKLTGKEVDQRLFGTAASVALVAPYTDLVRVHDVAQMRDVCRVADAFRGALHRRGSHG